MVTQRFDSVLFCHCSLDKMIHSNLKCFGQYFAVVDIFPQDNEQLLQLHITAFVFRSGAYVLLFQSKNEFVFSVTEQLLKVGIPWVQVGRSPVIEVVCLSDSTAPCLHSHVPTSKCIPPIFLLKGLFLVTIWLYCLFYMILLQPQITTCTFSCGMLFSRQVCGPAVRACSLGISP